MFLQCFPSSHNPRHLGAGRFHKSVSNPSVAHLEGGILLINFYLYTLFHFWRKRQPGAGLLQDLAIFPRDSIWNIQHWFNIECWGHDTWFNISILVAIVITLIQYLMFLSWHTWRREATNGLWPRNMLSDGQSGVIILKYSHICILLWFIKKIPSGVMRQAFADQGQGQSPTRL